MVTHILLAAQQDPTVMIGGICPFSMPATGWQGDPIVLESCEYCDSFLNFFPTLAVVLNEADHLDYFPRPGGYSKVLPKVRATGSQGGQGRVLANGDDPNTMEAIEGSELTTFGLGRKPVHGQGYSEDWRDFEVVCDGKFYCNIHLNVFGRHNAANAVAAAAVALGIPGEAVTQGLETFRGAGRRMEFKGNYNGADV